MKNIYMLMSKRHENMSSGIRTLFSLPALAVLILLLLAGKGWGQNVFYDDFNRVPVSPGGTPLITYTATNTGAGTEVLESTLTTGTVPYLKIANGSPAGRSYLTGPLSTYSTPFSTTLSSNPGLVTWSFNIRHNRGGGSTTTLSGFAATSYGIAVVLVATSSDLLASGCNGYAVVMGAPSSGNVYNLVRFTNGLGAQANFTSVIAGILPTSTSPNNLRDYMSIKVTYDPATNSWNLYERVDGLSAAAAWADPTTTSNLVGTATDNTYTNAAMSVFGYFWNYSTSSGTNSYFDNYRVNVTAVVTPTLSVAPSSRSGFTYIVGSGPSASQSYSLSGVNLTGASGNIKARCLTNYEVSTDNANFYDSVNVGYSSATLAATPVYVRLKGGLGIGNYNSEIVSNSGGGAATQNVTCSGFVVAGPTTYTWTGATNNDWQNSGNWSPARSAPAINDILHFNNGSTYTITNVPAQTIAQLQVTDGSKITLQAAAIATLTIAGSTGDDLAVSGTGSELNVSGTLVLTISLNTGTNGLISSSMTFSGAAHVLKAADASSLVFANGSVFKVTTGFTGNVFGTTSLNSVKFQAGSTYIQDAGANPFGAGQPNSVVTFEPGSLYKFTASSGGPSYSGRTYANFENDPPSTSTQNNQGSSPMTCDNYTVTSGTVNWDFSGGVVIKGNISVAPTATLTFGNATKLTNLTLSGTAAQTIGGTGTLTFGLNSYITVNNSAGIVLDRDIAADSLVFQSGIISTGANTFSLSSGVNLTGAGTGKYVHGRLQMNIPSGTSSTTFAIGDAANYTPVSLDFAGVTISGKLTATTTPGLHPNAISSGINTSKCVNRYWTLANNGISFATCDATFTFVPGDILGGANTADFIMMKWDPSTWNSTTISTRTSSTTKITGIASFSDFIDGEASCVTPVAFNVTGGGTYCSGGTGMAVGLDNSEIGVDYQLFIGGTTPVGLPVGGTGSGITFGDQAAAGSYSVTGTRTIGGCSHDMTGTVAITINPVLPVSVAVATDANPVCAGTQVTFTATPTHGGSSPVYAWYKNSTVVDGETGPAYVYTPVNGDQVYVQLTSSETCKTGSPAASDVVTMTVNPVLAVTVSLAADANPVCAGTQVTFTATPTHGGSSPVYAWYKNSTVVDGETGPAYVYTPVNGDQVYVQLTSSETCNTGSPATSDVVSMTVNPVLAVTVSLATDANPICAGTQVTFTATPTHGGSSPVYTWYKNSTVVDGETGPVYVYTPANGDQVYVQLTSSETCKTGSPAASDAITMIVNPVLPVGVSIAASANAVPTGTLVTFTATPVNGGISPVYTWYKNAGLVYGETGPSYAYEPADGDQVYVKLIADAACVSGNPATSNMITMIVINLNQTVSGNVINGQSECYDAVQTIKVAVDPDTFTVEPGGSANMIAGQNIIYYPGTTVQSGGLMHGKIAPGGPFCGMKSPSMLTLKTDTEQAGLQKTSSFFRIYPNPTNGSFTLELTQENPLAITKVEIFGMQGEKVLTSSISGEQKHTFSLDGNRAGCYFIRVICDDRSGVMKIIKQ